MEKPNIELVLDSVVDEVLDVSKNTVTGVKVRNVKTGAQRTIAVDGFFAAIGHKPNTDPFRGQLALDDKGYIIAKDTKTDIPGVFAAGDVQDKIYRQAITAAGSGCMAAIEVERYLQHEG
jgi:thioredoxin reductase (NADPH)